MRPKKKPKEKAATTRGRSDKQEKKLAKDFKARLTINSGATFSENDLRAELVEIEAKTTLKSTYSLRLDDWLGVAAKVRGQRIPTMVIRFEDDNSKQLAVIDYKDLKRLIKLAGAKK